jgi:hypothetical protein
VPEGTADLVGFFQEMEFLNEFLVEVSGHKRESFQTRVFVCFSTLIFPLVFLFRGFFCKDF